ncbi:MAG TPA: hypothetical protein VNX21_06845 [Candidatus Thermoplasmatota archaeon]|nr:hypothetical protein [Candidatus Thermoplasmatota archaeon]
MAARSRLWTPLGMALLCGHCALGVVGAVLALTGAASWTLLGLDWNWVWPPVAIVGGFALWLWSGRRDGAEACPPRGKA